MYKADSKIAEEFINHQEILDTMSYAETHKSNRALIESLIDKAARCKGLTHREAALLLECDQPDVYKRQHSGSKSGKWQLSQELTKQTKTYENME